MADSNLIFQGALLRGPYTAWKQLLDCLAPGSWVAYGGPPEGILEARRVGLAVRDSLFCATPSGPLLIWLLRAPLSETTLTRQALKTGTGGLAIDACRIQHASPEDLAQHVEQVQAIKKRGGSMEGSWKNSSDLSGANDVTTLGRWPANFLLVHHSECRKTGVQPTKGRVINRWLDGSKPFGGGAGHPYRGSGEIPEVLTTWECHPSCPAQQLGDQSGVRPGMSGGGKHRPGYQAWYCGSPDCSDTARCDTGTAARFFHQATDLDDLWGYIATLICPPGGLLLKPFNEGAAVL